jgi:hypothetical protein
MGINRYGDLAPEKVEGQSEERKTASKTPKSDKTFHSLQ